MNTFRFAVTLVAALTLGNLAGCAHSDKKETIGEYIDDTAITTSVKAAILNEPHLNVAEINVETYKGVVQLSGFVASPESVEKAARVARNVNGVKAVQNAISIK